jgi:hypothetical protein
VGLVASLNRPGGNATGMTLLSGPLLAKRVELARELLPSTDLLAVLTNPTNPENGRRHHLSGSNEDFDRAETEHQNHCRSAQPMSLMGHFPALPHCNSNGRFTPKSSRNSDKAALTLCAITGLMHCSKNPIIR